MCPRLSDLVNGQQLSQLKAENSSIEIFQKLIYGPSDRYEYMCIRQRDRLETDVDSFLVLFADP